MFFTTRKIGRVYVLRLLLANGDVVHKVGMCKSSRSTDRMFEILRSWFNTFRYVPHAVLKLDHECENPEELEKYFHKVLSSYNYRPEYNVQGYTEMFVGLDEIRLTHFIKNTYRDPGKLSKESYQV